MGRTFLERMRTRYPRGFLAVFFDVIGRCGFWVVLGVTPFIAQGLYGKNYVPLGVVVGYFLGAAWTGLFRTFSAHLRASPKRDILNAEARTILDSLSRSRKPESYWLYLRPFTADNSILTPNPFKELGEADDIDLENSLARVLEGSGRFAALGLGDAHQGFGRLEVPDNQWKKTFALLATNATGIIVVPFASAGTKWEVLWLKDQCKVLRKCIFVMPPKLELGAIEQWSNSYRVFKENGVDIPNYFDEGLFFSLTQHGKITCEPFLRIVRRHGTNKYDVTSYLDVEYSALRASILNLREGQGWTLDHWLSYRKHMIDVGVIRSPMNIE